MPTQAIRCKLLDAPNKIEHHGLYFSRFPARLDDESAAVRDVQKKVAETRVPEAYKRAYCRWKGLAVPDSIVLEVEALGPIAIGLGNANPSENGLSLHHTYGVPVIPGSALKGLTRRAMTVAKVDEKVIASLLGDDDKAEGGASEGAVTFFDAWLVPKDKGVNPLHPDTITVHHPLYYQSHGKEPPTDFDDPNPIPLLVIKPGVKFLLRLAINPAVGHTEASLELVKRALLWALENEGIGGKTNAGYGRMREAGASRPAMQPAPPRDEEARAILSSTELLADIERAPPGNVKAIEKAFETVKEKPEAEQRVIAKAIFKKINGGPFGRYRDEPWYEFAQRLGQSVKRR
jgi:CRISPR-associated protein Cmr6